MYLPTIMKRKFKQRCTTILLISSARAITSLLNSLNTKRGTATYDIGNPVFGFMERSSQVRCYREIQVKKSRCKGWFRSLVDPKWSSSHLVILISLLLYICHVSFQKMLISCLLKSIVLIKYFESDFLEKLSLSV